MPITFNLELDSKSNRKNELLVMIRCSLDRKHKRINTGIHVSKRYWDFNKKLVKRTHPLYLELNKTLILKQQELEEIYLKLRRDYTVEISLEDVINQYDKPKSVNFFEFAFKYKLNQFMANKKLGTY